MYDALRDKGYFLEILGSPLTVSLFSFILVRAISVLTGKCFVYLQGETRDRLRIQTSSVLTTVRPPGQRLVPGDAVPVRTRTTPSRVPVPFSAVRHRGMRETSSV